MLKKCNQEHPESRCDKRGIAQGESFMVVRLARLAPPIECVRLYDLEAGLDGFIAIHSTTLGPGAGGCRLWSYPDAGRALADAVRLAEGMSYKNALAGLPLGGAKAVLRKPDGPLDRVALFRAFGRAVEKLGGAYVTAEDVGTSVADMQEVAHATRHVAGLPPAEGCAGGDPSPWTAKGVFDAMEVAAAIALGRGLHGLTVAVQGTGNVGADLCRRLADAGARLIIADVSPVRRDRLKAVLGAEVVDVSEIASVDADIFAPCALGGVLDRRTVASMKAKLVCGAANNQLANADAAAMLVERGIVYAPDYVVNAGGIINVSAEYLGETESDVEARVAEIGPRVGALLERAAREGRSPALVADEMAEEVIAGAQRAAA
jgi:leucine dehydrogenase